MDTMTAKQRNDFESRFFDLLRDEFKELQKRFTGLEKKVDINTKETRAAHSEAQTAAKKADEVSRTVQVLDGAVFPKKPLNPWYKDDKIIKIILWIVASLILIYAAVNNIKLPGAS